MEILKPTDADKENFRSVVPDDPRAEVKAMFGNLAAFVNGNMFMGLFGPNLGVQLSEDDGTALEAVGGTRDFGPEGRPMKKYIRVPDGWADDAGATVAWAEMAFDHVSSFPPKHKKG